MYVHDERLSCQLKVSKSCVVSHNSAVRNSLLDVRFRWIEELWHWLNFLTNQLFFTELSSASHPQSKHLHIYIYSWCVCARAHIFTFSKTFLLPYFPDIYWMLLSHYTRKYHLPAELCPWGNESWDCTEYLLTQVLVGIILIAWFYLYYFVTLILFLIYAEVRC